MRLCGNGLRVRTLVVDLDLIGMDICLPSTDYNGQICFIRQEYGVGVSED